MLEAGAECFIHHLTGRGLAALSHGATVYISSTTVYRAYKRMGIDVRRLGAEYLRDAREGFARPSADVVARHRAALSQHQDREWVVAETRGLLEALSAGRSGTDRSR